MEFKTENCKYCNSKLISERDDEVKICNKCKIRWHYRDDDGSWRYGSFATEEDVLKDLLVFLAKKPSNIEEVLKRYSIEFKDVTPLCYFDGYLFGNII